MLSGAPLGPMIGLVGRVAARVSPSRLPGTVAALMTHDTSGRSGFGSLRSAGLAASLVSRLQARASGSILYRLTWKIGATPSQRLIWRLRASPGRTSVSDFSGWPTPTTPSGGQTTPPGTSATGRRPDGSKATVSLQTVVALAGWGSPKANNGNGPGRRGDGALNLQTQSVLAGWATTTSRDWRSDRGQLTSEELYGSKGQPLARQVLYSDVTGSSVTTPKSGLLRPEHSRWLLRLPPAWDDCMVTAMPSTRKHARSS